MKTALFLVFILICCPAARAQQTLTGGARDLYQQAKLESRFFHDAENLHPDLVPTSDGKSFFVIWKPTPSPDRWIVSLHGAGQPARGFATDDLAIWSRHLRNRKIGVICLQWWLGTGSATGDFYSPREMYREIDSLLQRLRVKPGTVMLHGFSRGSTNTFSLSAIDRSAGKHYFGLNVASSGGVALDYPPTREIVDGKLGQHPLRDTKWITVAGARDPHPERDGITGMRSTAEWLRSQGAVVLISIEDPTNGHGALQTNPQNASAVLDRFEHLN
ncbi:MAG: hypothetical protein U0136_19020 [Bdellovibrionota bacterium]